MSSAEPTGPEAVAGTAARTPAVLIAGVGVLHATDLSFGRVLLEELERLPWPGSVVLEDLSYCPLMVYQWLEEAPAAYDRAIFLTADQRGREPGTLELRTWDRQLPGEEEIQARIADAYMGIVSLENLLIICEYFGALPAEVLVLEIEPLEETWGVELSPRVAARLGEAIDLVRREAERRLG